MSEERPEKCPSCESIYYKDKEFTYEGRTLYYRICLVCNTVYFYLIEEE